MGNGHRIQKFSSQGTFLAKWGSYGSGTGQFDHAFVGVSRSGHVYVADFNTRVQKFTAPLKEAYTYDQIGNITSRKGSSYTYGSSKPHAVTQIGLADFAQRLPGSA